MACNRSSSAINGFCYNLCVNLMSRVLKQQVLNRFQSTCA